MMRMMCWVLACLCLSSTAWAEKADMGDDAMAGLLQVLEVETAIATKTKMNADFVPGMVTVLQGEELESLGYQNVWESLALVPGIHLGLSLIGEKEVNFRGVGGVFASSKYQLLVDGMPAYNTATGMASAYHIDVAQIERIEVIRGPGSAIYGGDAYIGVINVVMRKGSNRVVVREGSFNSKQKVVMAGKQSGEELDWHVNVGSSKTSGVDSIITRDYLSGTALKSLSNAPGHSNEKLNAMNLNAGISYGGFSLQTLYIDVKEGDYFGLNSILPNKAQAGFMDYQDFTLRANQHVEISDETEFDAKLEYRSYDFNSHFMVALKGVVTSGGTTLTETTFKELAYAEDKYTAGLSLTNRSLEDHHLLLGLDYSQLTTRDVAQTANYDPSNTNLGNLPVKAYTGAKNWLTEGISRKNIALYVQDQIELSHQLSLTLGMRYDHYDDVGDSTNPRVAMVYQLDENNMLKAQFATAFRPPTFLEIHDGRGSMKPETNQNIELGYVYRDHNSVARITLYNTLLKDVILLNSTGTYENVGESQVQGVELEGEVALSQMWMLKGNVSHNYRKDTGQVSQSSGSADWLGNAVVSFYPAADYTFTLWGRYVGARHRSSTDTRAPLGSDTTFDLSMRKKNLWLKGLGLRMGVRNMFDHVVIYPSDKGTHPDDYPRAGRTWWMQTSYEF